MTPPTVIASVTIAKSVLSQEGQNSDPSFLIPLLTTAIDQSAESKLSGSRTVALVPLLAVINILKSNHLKRR